MKKISYLGFIVGSLLFISCNDEEQAPQQAQGPKPFPVIEVPVRTVTGYTSYPASLEGTISSDVRAKVSGYITDVLVDAGEEVEEGQPLFRLETESLNQDAEAAQASVNAAQVEVNKLIPLVEKDIISEVQLQTARAQLQQAQANYSSIAANIGYATINSPVDGSVGSINFREGALVSPGDPQPLTRVSDTDEMYAFFSMNEEDYLSFLQNTPGQSLSEKIENFPPVEFRLSNGEIYPEKGEIQTVTGQVDPSTGTVGFRAVFPNNGLLSTGASGSIRIPQTYEDVPVVPQSASYEQQGRTYVYRVHGDSVVVSTSIVEGARVENLIVVEGGVSPGDLIVAEGVVSLRNNMPIRPQPVPFDSITKPLQPVFK